MSYLSLPTLATIRSGFGQCQVDHASKPDKVVLGTWFYAMFGVENVGSATRRDLSQRSSGDTAILYDHWPFATIRVFAGSECTGEKGDHIRAISPNFIVQGDPSTFVIGSHQTCVLFHRLLVASYHLSSNFNGKTLPPDGGYSEADGGWNEKQGECLDIELRMGDGVTEENP